MDQDPIYKVVDRSNPSHPHIYIFIGQSRYERVRDIVEGWKGKPILALPTLSKIHHQRLEDVFGDAWDLLLGLPDASPWTYMKESKRTSRSRSRSRSPAPEDPTHLAPDLLERMRIDHRKIFSELRKRTPRDSWTYHFVPLLLFSDDTVTMLRAKIYCAQTMARERLPSANMPVPPEWQMLTYRLQHEIVIPGTFFYERNFLTNTFDADSFKEPEIRYPYGKEPFLTVLQKLRESTKRITSHQELTNLPAWDTVFKVISRQIRIDVVPNVLWATKGEPMSREVELLSLSSAAEQIRSWMDESPVAPLLQEPLRHGLMNMYLATNTVRARKLLDALFKRTRLTPAELERMATEDLGDFCPFVREDNRRMEAVAEISMPALARRNAAKLALTMVNVNTRSPHESPGAIPVREIFDQLEMERGLVFAEYYGNGVGRRVPLHDRLVKMHTGPETLNDATIQKWLIKTNEKDTIHPNQLILKFSYPHIKHGDCSMTLRDSGKLILHISWNHAVQANLEDVKRIFHEISTFIEQVVHPIVKAYRDSPELLPLPPSEDVFHGKADHMELTSVNAYMFMEHATFPPYDQLRKIVNLLAPAFEPLPSVSLSKLAEDPVLGRLAPVLRTLGLDWSYEGLQELQKRPYRAKEWGTISEVEALRMLKAIRQQLAMAGKSLRVVYRRYNGHQGVAHIRRILEEFLARERKSYADLHTPEFIFRITREIIQKYHYSPDDAREKVMSAIKSLSGDSENLPKQLNLLLYAEDNRIDFKGLKDFKNNSSMHQIIERVEWLMSRIAAKPAALLKALEKDSSSAHRWNDMALDRFDVGDTNVEDLTSDENLEEYLMSSWLNENTEEDLVNDDIEEVMNDATIPLLNDDSDDDEEEEGEDEDVATKRRKMIQVLDEQEKESNWKLMRLARLDPGIFADKAGFVDQKKNQNFARRCVRDRQPVIMTPEEFQAQLDKSKKLNQELPFPLPKAMPNGFRYRGNYYICPDLFCERMAQAVSPSELRSIERDAKGNIQSGICPDGQPVRVNYSTSKFPRFYTKSLESGWSVPCCFVADWSLSKIKKQNTLRMLERDQQQRENPEETGNDVNVRMKEDLAPVAEVQLRYVLTAKKDIGVQNNRYAYLEPAIDRIFNDSPLDPKKDAMSDPAFRRVLRLGVLPDVEPFLACVMKLYNLYRVQQGEKPLYGEGEFRAHLANHLHNDDVFLTVLKRGRLRSEFEFFPGYQYHHAFRSYLMTAKIDHDILWELCVRPLPWLFPEGLALVVLDRSTTPGSDIQLHCPPPYLLRHIRKAPQAAFMVQTADTYQLIVDTEPVMKPRPFFPRTHIAVETCLSALDTCGVQAPTEDAVTEDVAQTLQMHGMIQAQWIHGLHRLKGFVLEEGVLLPLPGDPAVVPHVALVRHVTYPTLAVALRVLQRAAKVLGAAWTPKAWAVRYEPGPERIGAIELANGLFAPVQPVSVQKDKPAKLPRSPRTFIDIDEDLWNEQPQPDERIRAMNDVHYTRQLYEHFLREVSGFLRKELMMTPDEPRKGEQSSGWRRRYWFVIYDILQSKRTLAEKQNAIVHLFDQGLPDLGLKPLLSILASHEEVPDMDMPKTSATTPLNVRGRQQCFERQTNIVGPRNCLALPRCTVQNKKCKLYIPRALRDKFLVWFVEDLLRNRLQRAHILNHRWNDVNGHSRLEITPNMLVFDASMASLIYKLVKHPEEVHRIANSTMDTGPTGRERVIMSFFANRNLEKLKSKGEFGTTLYTIPPTLQPYLSGFLVRKTPSVIENLWYLASHLPTHLAPVSEQQFRTQLMDYLQRSGTFQVYIQRQKTEGGIFRGIRSFVALRELFLSEEYVGNIRDLDLVSKVFPLHFYILRVTSRGATLEHRICSPHPNAKLSLWYFDTSGKMHMLVRKSAEEGDKTSRGYQHVFDATDLPLVFLNHFRLASTICTPYRPPL